MSARDDRPAATKVCWTVFSRRRDGTNAWCEWISAFSEADGIEFLEEHRRDYPHYAVELRKVTTTEERVDV